MIRKWIMIGNLEWQCIQFFFRTDTLELTADELLHLDPLEEHARPKLLESMQNEKHIQLLAHREKRKTCRPSLADDIMKLLKEMRKSDENQDSHTVSYVQL
eukprot:TRINITY_DN4097_c0_g1_i18.p2 TRINITY_DN4097_c0_g1~~TRINITY_DN4097_c0_g1_i18.p2  ORF type:complete len:101 (-),score=12.97 TRINITY_DN4097_c0_g1_i18:751-1053(-)